MTNHSRGAVRFRTPVECSACFYASSRLPMAPAAWAKLFGMTDDLKLDRPLTPQEEERARLLTAADLQRIDECLLSHASDQWRKVARVIGRALMELSQQFPNLPDGFCSLRLKHLVKSGTLEAAGNLNRMRHSEVRIAGPRSTDKR